MRITIIPQENSVGIDRVFKPIDLSDMDSTIHAIQFNTVSAVGHVEYTDKRPEKLTSIAAYQSTLDAWNAYVPPTPIQEPGVDRQFSTVPGSVDTVAELRQRIMI